MTRRGYMVAIAVLITFLAYAPICYAMFRRVMLVLVHVTCVHDRGRPAPPNDYFGLPPLPSTIDICGYATPIWFIVLLWIVVPGTWLMFEFLYWLRRKERESRGLCIECGAKLHSFRGHCPGCGTRLGIGLPTRRYVLNMPRNA